jgi:hypothetical protein
MNRRRFIAVASGFAVAAVGLILWLPASVGAATTGAGPRYVVLNCMDKAQVEPGTISLACADDGVGLTGLHWTSWTSELASAYGTEWENDCQPNCAAGHIRDYPVLVELWGSAAVPGHPAERRYLQATLSYPKGRPPVYAMNCNHKVVATYPVTQAVPLGRSGPGQRVITSCAIPRRPPR